MRVGIQKLLFFCLAVGEECGRRKGYILGWYGLCT